MVRKYQMIFNTLNLFQESQSLLIGSFWASQRDEHKIIDAVDRLKEDDPNFISANIYPVTHDKKPPSFFRLNDFTAPFQVIVETFSIPRYKEINPAVVTSITFPFLFGVMFGDVAHGLALFCIGIAVARSDLGSKPATKAIFGLRYLFLMMGFFSVYCGFIYNDFMGVKMFNAESCYVEKLGAYVRKKDCTYPLGFDHVWGMAKNEISFANSFKMKFSIIFGYFHMMIGILFKGELRSRRLERALLQVLRRLLLRVHTASTLHDLHLRLHEPADHHQVAQRVAPELPLGHRHLHLAHLRRRLPSQSQKHPSSTTPSTKPRCRRTSSVGRPHSVIAAICFPVLLFAKPLILNHLRKKRMNSMTVIHHNIGLEEHNELHEPHKLDENGKKLADNSDKRSTRDSHRCLLGPRDT